MSDRLTLDMLIAWLASLQPQPPLEPWPSFMHGPYIHEMPDRLITVTMLPGNGFAFEGGADQPTFQVRVRSAQNNQADGEAVANEIDFAIFNQVFPQLVQDVKVLLVTRQAGAPAPLGPPDDANRFDYVCTYRTVIGVQ